MHRSAWAKEEHDFLVSCIKSSYSFPEAAAKFGKKYKLRTSVGLRLHLQQVGVDYTKFYLRRSARPLTDKLLEAELKDKIRDMQNEILETQKEVKNIKQIKDIIHNFKQHDFSKLPTWNVPKITKGLTGRPFLVLSDIHYGEVIKPEQVNYINQYDRKISAKRLEYVFKMAVDLPLHRFNQPRYDGFVCALNGDLVSGNIHEELAETNDGPLLESVIEITGLLIKGIALLADSYGRVFVPCVVGNHGRIRQKPRYKNKAQDNYEWIAYHYIAEHFKNDDRVYLTISDASDLQYQIYGIKFLQTHGDQFRGGSGISGLFSPLMLGLARKQTRQQAMQLPFDVMITGHFHQYLHMEKLVMNGSLCGYDEFAFNLNLPYEQPKQSLFIVHPKWGIIYRMPIIATGYEKKKETAQKSVSI